MKRRRTPSLLIASWIWVSSSALMAGEMDPGDILACNSIDNGVVMIVDPVTGDRQVLSDLGDPGQGPLGEDPRDIALDSGGTIALLEADIPAVFWVDPQTGQRSLLSDLSNPGQGPTAPSAWAITTASDQSFLVTLGNPINLLVRVDRDTGQRTEISDFTNPAQGPIGRPVGVVELPSGDALVSTFVSDTSTSAVLRVEAGSGERSVLSDFGDGGPNAYGLTGMVLDPDGQALVSWSSQLSCISEIYRIDPDTGDRILVSDEVIVHSNDLAVESDGQILATGYFGGFCGGGLLRLYRVDPASGDAVLLGTDISSSLAVMTATIRGIGFETGDLSRWSGFIN